MTIDTPRRKLSQDDHYRIFRLMMDNAGCLKCPDVRIVHGRNRNTYQCEMKAAFETMPSQMKKCAEARRAREAT